jgi:glycosyltransferase involved in cell wall biosynthesis
MPQESNALCTDRPSVSIVIACRNEEAHIVNCIESLVDEFTQQECEFVIADGMSTDRTFEIIRELQARYHNIRLFRNVGIIQACGLNLAIDQCAGDVVVRADAHCTYPEEYVKTCVARHRDSGAANLGGLADEPSCHGSFVRSCLRRHETPGRHW